MMPKEIGGSDVEDMRIGYDFSTLMGRASFSRRGYSLNMCGICGQVSRNEIENRTPVSRMRKALHHRGPDSEGRFDAVEVSLGVRRLSIIDLAHGQQPLYNEDRSLVAVVNGEIYNFVELTADLKSRNHHFATGSDAETVLHLYEEYGADCVRHLRGMFAFALWDAKRKQLLLARDRLGEKPLYLYFADGLLTFASELKALLCSGVVPFELDPHAIDLYFHYGYVPEPLTPLKNVRKLPAAHYLLLQTQTWNIDEQCYWRMEDAPPLHSDPAETIAEELDTISRMIIRSDVPVGVALSGGMDSGAVTALAARHYSGTLHAFCVGYPGSPEFDERSDARRMADHFQIPFHDTELRTEEVADSFPDLIYWTDDPVADIAGSAYFAVMNLAKQHRVPVIMLGHGGDELFWGYPWVVNAVKESEQKKILLQSGWISTIGAYFDMHLPDTWSPRAIKRWAFNLGGLRPVLNKVRRHKQTPPERLVFYDLTPDFQMSMGELADLYTPAFADQVSHSSAADPFSVHQPWEAIDILITRLISETYLLGNGIAQADRLSMACSIEARLPLVDYRLYEVVVGLRKVQKDYRLPPKSWLKEAVKDILPAWAFHKPKRGFQPPVREWHRAIFEKHGKLLERGFLSQSKVLSESSTHMLSQGTFVKGAVSPISYKALVLELWCRRLSSLIANEGSENVFEPGPALHSL